MAQKGSDPDGLITELEREEILARIDDVVTGSKRSAPEKPLTPSHRGLLLPVLVNASALVLIIGAIILSLSIFKTREETISIEAEQYLSTEAKILEEFRRETAERLQEKDTAILKILGQLNTLETERREISQIMDIRLREKETELRSALQAELEAEQGRLEAISLSTTEIERQLRAFQLEKEIQYTVLLDSYRGEAETLANEREMQLLQEKELARRILEKTTIERERLFEQAQVREIELLTALEGEKKAQAELVASARSQWTSLMQKDQQATRRILDAYEVVLQKIRAEQYPSATEELLRLKALLSSDDIRENPTTGLRVYTDLAIVEVFEGFLRDRRALDPTSPAQDNRTAEDLYVLRENVIQQEFKIDRLNEELELVRREITAAEQTALQQGRQSALAELQQVLRNLETRLPENVTGPLTNDPQVRDKEPLFRSVITQISGLITASESKATQRLKILGTVSLTAQDSVTITPLVEMELAPSVMLEIRRVLPNGDSVPVAAAKISDIAPNKVLASVTSTYGGRVPKVTDQVFVDLGGSDSP